jgi:hypothetical protein
VLAILDEVGQVKGPQSDFVDAITTAQGAYENPLLIAISTQAPTDADLFSIWLDGAEASKDPRIVSHVYTAPEGCDLDDEAGWKAANPALDLFRSRKDLEEQAQRAKEMPSAQNTFRVLCLNQRVNMFSPLIGKDEWMACRGSVEFEPGEAVYLALDLSSVNDLSALVMVSADDTDRVQGFLWKPSDVLDVHGTRDNVDYRAWAKDEHLLTSPGPTIDPAVIAMKIVELTQTYKCSAWPTTAGASTRCQGTGPARDRDVQGRRRLRPEADRLGAGVRLHGPSGRRLRARGAGAQVGPPGKSGADLERGERRRGVRRRGKPQARQGQGAVPHRRGGRLGDGEWAEGAGAGG